MIELSYNDKITVIRPNADRWGNESYSSGEVYNARIIQHYTTTISSQGKERKSALKIFTIPRANITVDDVIILSEVNVISGEIPSGYKSYSPIAINDNKDFDKVLYKTILLWVD